MPDGQFGADKDRTVLRALIRADLVVTPEATERPRGQKAQISLTVRTRQFAVGRHPQSIFAVEEGWNKEKTAGERSLQFPVCCLEQILP